MFKTMNKHFNFSYSHVYVYKEPQCATMHFHTFIELFIPRH